MEKIIIHISGASGSGKTTLGNKLKNKFKSKIIVKDLDDLLDEYIKKTYDTTKHWNLDEIKYQKYIDEFVIQQKNPIVFVGLNDNHLGIKKKYYNIHCLHKFYIDITNEEILKQRCLRLLTEEIPNDKNAMKDLIDNNEKFISGLKQAINNQCNLKKLVKENIKLRSYYEKQSYKFMSRKNIYESVSNILNEI
jgi:hypothetical protein